MGGERFDEGMVVRREVLGDAYVDRAVAATDELSEPVQEIITEFAWGTVWRRPGLPRPTRSLVTVTALIALNRQHELRTHIRGALNNGVTREELRELIVHLVPYCGAPAALDAMRALREVLAEAG